MLEEQQSPAARGGFGKTKLRIPKPRVSFSGAGAGVSYLGSCASLVESLVCREQVRVAQQGDGQLGSHGVLGTHRTAKPQFRKEKQVGRDFMRSSQTHSKDSAPIHALQLKKGQKLHSRL